jgi:hypothetical protein
MHRPLPIGFALLCLVLLAGAGLAASQEPGSRATMRRVFDSVAVLVPVAFAESGDPWKEQAPEVQASLRALRDASAQVAAHGKGQDASFRFLSDSLAAQTRTLGWQLARKDYDGASNSTQRLVETCVACHVRLPATREGDFAQGLLGRIDRSSLTPFARAGIEAAGRQFDAALATYEAQFADPEAALESYDFSDAISAYLIVALRVKRDPARARRGLDLLAKQRDLGAQFELNLEIWRRALRELEPALREPPTLERARQILDAGHLLSEFPLDAADEVHAIVASSVLYRYLEEKRPTGEDLAQALYLLARSDAFTRRSFETSESASYLELAIGAAPHSAIARRAYARLELQTLLEYSTPFGVELPDEVNTWLRELRERAREVKS